MGAVFDPSQSFEVQLHPSDRWPGTPVEAGTSYGAAVKPTLTPVEHDPFRWQLNRH